MGRIHIIPDYNNIKESLSVAEKWNATFEYNDFFRPDILDDQIEVEKRIRLYRQLERPQIQDTLHGAFFDLSIHSQDKKIAEVSCMRMCQSMEIASKLNVCAVIFHTNALSGFQIVGYEENWLNVHEKFFQKMLSEYRGISIYVENMFDRSPRLLKRLAERMDGTNFGVCFDVAHANLTETPLDEWIIQLAPYIRHMHLNDNDGNTDLHQPIGDGKIDWQKVNHLVEQQKINGSVLVEVADLKGAEKSLQYMKENGLYPFK